MTSNMITDISNFIFVSDLPKKVDAIFLPGGSHPEQPEYASKLYQDGYAKWLVPSGGVSVKRDRWPGVRSKANIYDGNYESDHDFFVDVFLKNGVPNEAIIKGENKSGHTRDNAFFSQKIIEERGIKIQTAMIVCKAFHARRCLMLYQLAFPKVDFIVCPVCCYDTMSERELEQAKLVHSERQMSIMDEVYDITKDNWYKSEQGIDRVFGELARCGNQFILDIKTYLL